MAPVNLAGAEGLIDSDPAAAAAAARQALAVNSSDAAAYRLLGASLRRLGQDEEANSAELAAIEASGNDPELIRAQEALKLRQLTTAEAILRRILDGCPTDVVAIQLIGEVAAAAGLLIEAERRHRRALSLAPGFEYARLHLAHVLNNQRRHGEALAEARKITGELRQFEGYRMLLGDALTAVGESESAIQVYREILAAQPTRLGVWSRLAFLLRAVGRRDEAIEACRSALKVSPTSGMAWSALADIKTYRFSDEDIEALKRGLADMRLPEEDRLRLHFALGKAFEDRKDYRSSFNHYRHGNELRARQLKYSRDHDAALLERIRRVFTTEFLESMRGKGDPAPDPIFVIGLPRSGSSLVEQILASHPMVEGTGELTDIHVLATSLCPDERANTNLLYFDQLASLSDAQLRELGALYLERTRIQRKTDRPFFVDKLPNNWMHVGFIKLILPNAKIIDARRHPLACGFSNYKQVYSRGQEFSYDLGHIGTHYDHYIQAMAHFDEVAPGMVHRVIHEQLVADAQGEIRRLLDYLGLPFDEACVRFNETERQVLTASSEQVRQPLRPDFLDRWKAFEPELAPLKEALGPALGHWDDPQPR